MSQVLTKWFPGNVKPWVPGVYERKDRRDDFQAYSYWTGTEWRFSANTPDRARKDPDRSAMQRLIWRGLREKG